MSKRTFSYDYDPIGSRSQVTDNGSPVTYTANALNQYTQMAVGGLPMALSYDGNGNLTGQADWVYTYDAQNRLISAVGGPSSVAAYFAYDARNRCVRRTTYSWTTGSWLLTSDSFLTYDGWSLIEKRDATGALLDKYIHGATIDEILVRYNGGAIYYHHDGLGSVTHLTDVNGALVESYQYDVYGAVSVFDSVQSPVTTPPITRFTYTGREYLADIDLYDYRNRFYSAMLGRFLQTDPIRFEAGDVNLYRYVGNRVARFVDRFGLQESESDPCCPNGEPFDCANAKQVLNRMAKRIRDAVASTSYALSLLSG